MDRISPNHHDGTSDATPGGKIDHRRPGETIFVCILLVSSCYLVWHAYGIENPFGPNGLASPRAIPLATTTTMVISSSIILFKTYRRPLDRAETISRDILPAGVIIFSVFLVLFGFVLKPLGFLPTSAIFLIAAIKTLSKKGWLWCLGVSFVSLTVIWLIFRIIFSVLMPAGIVPEAEIIQFFRDLLSVGT